MNGKIVGTTTLRGTLQLGAETWIDKNGGDSHTVHFVEVPSSSMTPALKQGRIDAAMLGEPLLTANKADIEVLGNAFAAIAPTWISSTFAPRTASNSRARCCNPESAPQLRTGVNASRRSRSTCGTLRP